MLLKYLRHENEICVCANDHTRHFLVLAALVIALGLTGQIAAQAPPLQVEDLPLAQYGGAKQGETVTPVYEGWYQNPDGTFTLSFGYYNRNTEEVLEIPIGSQNQFMGVSENIDHGQPTRFEPGRHWGVFGVRVPPDFGEGEAVWELNIRGRTFEIPGQLLEDWMLPAITGDAMGNMPPKVRLDASEMEAFGPGSGFIGHRTAQVGRPVALDLWASDDGIVSNFYGETVDDKPVTLKWFVHRGAGAVSFSQETAQVPSAGGEMTTQISFATAGEYILRIRVNDDSGIAPAGHEQCCWTNGFVGITVTP